MNEKILVIEEAGKSYQMLRDKLREKGLDVVLAQNETEFWEQIKEPWVKLVIFDICLKNRLSINVYHALLDFSERGRIPSILMTGLTEGEGIETALYDENYVFFPSSVNFERLYREIQRLLNRQQMTAAA